jgi:hypothetical protein
MNKLEAIEYFLSNIDYDSDNVSINIREILNKIEPISKEYLDELIENCEDEDAW